MAKQKTGNPKGVLNPKEGQKYFTLTRFEPSKQTAFFVEHYWIVECSLPEQKSYRQDILSYPSVHLVFEKEKTKIYGVVTGKFTREIKGSGKVLGIKFRAGGFYPFLKTPVSSFTDSTIALDHVFDINAAKLENKILALEDNEQMFKYAENFLNKHLPEKDERVQLVNEIVDSVISDNKLIKVDQLVEKFGIGKRSLQRLFNRYVGVSPKWVIKRFRLHEVAGKLAENGETDWAKLAVDLGYFDQSHFIRDFRSIVGKTPVEYAESIRLEN